MPTALSKKKPPRFAPFVARWKDRLARSRQVFLLSLIVACGIEVLVDWNSTLFEINVLRGRVRERGLSYVHILAGAADEPMGRGDAKTLAALSEGLFSDEEVIFVRFVDPAATVLYEQLEPRYGAAFEKQRGGTFQSYFAKPLARDVKGVMHDPEGQRERMASSRWRDFPQRWNDTVNAVLAKFVEPTPPRPGSGRVMYQEALRTIDREREGAVTYAFGTVPRGEGIAGAVVVAFDMERTNASIRNKYLKGLGMVLFFLGLIVFQNLTSRQSKLKLLELEGRYAAAKAALREALPGVVQAPGLWACGALDQAEGKVDGQLYALHVSDGAIDALVVDPDGEGIEAAAVALMVRQAFVTRRAQGPTRDLSAEAAALGTAASSIPLTRPLGLLLVHLDASGAAQGLIGPVGGVRLLRGGAAAQAGLPVEIEAPPGVVGPLRRFECTLAVGEALVLASAGLGAEDGKPGIDLDALAQFVVRSGLGAPPRAEAMADAASWLRGKSARHGAHDLCVLALVKTA